MDITRLTSILIEDVISTLHMLGILVNIRDPVDGKTKIDMSGAESKASNDAYTATVNGYNSTEQYVLVCPPDLLASALAKYPPGQLSVDPSRLHWAPLYVVDPKKDKWSRLTYTGSAY